MPTKRRFELTEGTSSKFWEVAQTGAVVVVTFGRIGTAGQTKEKTLESVDLAEKEIDKLVREKTAKGYAEVGRSGAAAKASPPAARPTEATPVPSGPPGRFAFLASDDELFERGWPHLRILTEESVPAKTAVREAKKGFAAGDPYFPTAIPRDVARRYLLGYAASQTEANSQVDKLVASDGAVDDAVLAAVLERKVPPSPKRHAAGETYAFRLEEIILCFEAFLGTEPVVQALVAHLVLARENPQWWDDPQAKGFFVDHDHTEVQRVAGMLGWLRFRISLPRWKELVAPLADSHAPKLPRYSARLRALADDSVALDDASRSLDVALQRRDRKGVAEQVASEKWFHDDPQVTFVLGPDYLLTAPVQKLPQYPKWQQLRLVSELGRIRAPGVARVMAALLPSRSAGSAAASFLEARRDWVEREAMPALAAIDPGTVSTLRAFYAGAPGTAPPTDKKHLARDLKTLMGGVGAKLSAAKGDPVAELAVLRTVFARYSETRAAQGELIPEAYFTHTLGDYVESWKVDRATLVRWMDLAVQAATD